MRLHAGGALVWSGMLFVNSRVYYSCCLIAPFIPKCIYRHISAQISQPWTQRTNVFECWIVIFDCHIFELSSLSRILSSEKILQNSWQQNFGHRLELKYFLFPRFCLNAHWAVIDLRKWKLRNWNLGQIFESIMSIAISFCKQASTVLLTKYP